MPNRHNMDGKRSRLKIHPDGALALRLGLRQIKGFRQEDAIWLVAARGNGYPIRKACGGGLEFLPKLWNG
ncbi:MAG: hypothetical protein L3J21_07195 [Devosiaceae bacterium]|nr:hypothetical protein [Devosiaceae bacterium]